jgi:hypothetical protein
LDKEEGNFKAKISNFQVSINEWKAGLFTKIGNGRKGHIGGSEFYFIDIVLEYLYGS